VTRRARPLLLVAAGGQQHFAEVAECVALHVEHVGAFADRDGLGSAEVRDTGRERRGELELEHDVEPCGPG
jgi:hypothetical protein